MQRFKRVRTLYYGFTTLTVVSFVLWLAHGALAFVNSSFLAQFISPTSVSLVFALQSAVILFALVVTPLIARTIGVRTFFILLLPIFQTTILFLGLSQGATQAVVFFILQGLSAYLLFYLLDLYIENLTEDENTTGNVRGIFLTSGNIAVFFAPLIIGLFVIHEHYPPLYALSALALIIPFGLALTSLKHLTPRTPRRDSFIVALQILINCKRSVAYVIGAHLLLQIFFAWVTIYAPLLLLQVGGYSWQVIGILFSVALLAYIILEIPLGILADRYFGETEIMALGFLILALSTALLAFIPLSLVVAWGFVFFMTRVGAAMAEIATETYFFKQVTSEDAALVSIFRMTRSLGLLVGPLIALAFLPVTGLQYLFGVFGAILLAGIPFALRIRDTK